MWWHLECTRRLKKIVVGSMMLKLEWDIFVKNDMSSRVSISSIHRIRPRELWREQNYLARALWVMINFPMPVLNVWHSFRTTSKRVCADHLSVCVDLLIPDCQLPASRLQAHNINGLDLCAKRIMWACVGVWSFWWKIIWSDKADDQVCREKKCHVNKWIFELIGVSVC